MTTWQMWTLSGCGILTAFGYAIRRVFGPDRSSRVMRRVRDAAILIVGLTILIPVSKLAGRLAPDHRETFQEIIRKLEDTNRTGV